MRRFIFTNGVTLILAFLCFVKAYSQLKPEVGYRHYTSRDGLPSTQVSSVFEDRDGNVWFTTDRGAARFDGYSFRNYTTIDGLPHNNVLLINQDHKGRMWFMSSNGAFSYMEKDSILDYKGNASIKKLIRKMPASLFFDEGDTLWVTNLSGDQLLKCYGDSVSEFVIPPNMQQMLPTFYLRKVGDKLVSLKVGEAGANNELLMNDNITYLLSIAGECKLGCSAQVDKNRWVLAGPDTYVVFDESGNITANFDPSPYVFGSMDKDRTGNLWITNSNGAYRLDSYQQDPSTGELFFEGHFITSVLEDQVGNYWFTDRDNGVFFVPNIHLKTIRSFIPSKQNKITSLKIRDGLIYYSDAAGQVYELNGKQAVPVLKETPPSGVSLDFGWINAEEMIVGNLPCIYNVKKNKIRSLESKSTVRDCFQLSGGGCALAFSDGAGFIDASGLITNFQEIGFKERCNVVFDDPTNGLWIGANNGLYRYKDGAIENISDKYPELKTRVMDIDRLDENTTLIATRTSGIYILANNQLYNLNEAKGLVSNLVDCISVQDKNTFWCGSGLGLTRITVGDLSKNDVSYFHLDNSQGMPSNEVNDVLFYKDVLYAATTDGIVFFEPSTIAKNPVAPYIHITAIRINNELTSGLDSLALKYNETDVRIDFKAICFRNDGNTQYRYRLSGIHQEWIYTNEGRVQFVSLAPGEYVFEVSAMNEDGVWNEPPIKTHFSIAAHFTATWWFRTLLILAIIGLSVLVAFWYVRSQKQKHIVQTKMHELRQQALNANMNPHFIFNALNSIQHYINQNNQAEANEYMSHFSRLIRMNMETTSHTFVSLEDELERLELYLKLEKSRFGDNLNYLIELKDIEAFDVTIPPMLLQPYVENAIWHGILPLNGHGLIRLVVQPGKENYYEIMITDNGVGVEVSLKSPRQQSHKSMSMEMNRERLRLLSLSSGKTYSVEVVDMKDTEGYSSGTRVRFVLPKNLDE
jgi:Histidine kinase/Y_Y_Y domain/Two component regulator propeller